MLVLNRYVNQSIVVPMDSGIMTISLVDIRKDGAARLGFDAPRDVEIYRSEVWESVQRTGKRKAAMIGFEEKAKEVINNPNLTDQEKVNRIRKMCR